MTSPSRVAAAASILLSSLVLAACGDLEDQGSGDNARGQLTSGTTANPGEPRQELPPRPPGVVQVDGALDGSLTELTLTGFDRNATKTGLAVSADAAQTDEATAFAALCSGETDLVDASRQITETETEACNNNGLQVVDFQIAFDATVIATRNERDVGADCVNFDQLRAMYGAGSPVTSWTQLNPNFFPLRLVPIGPTEDSSDFLFFGQRVLGDPQPTLGTYRSDYQGFDSQNRIKNEINPINPPGWVGIVSFSFYELFEDKLRPLEIDGQTGDRCVFPSTETIASESYPLERTLRIYTTQRSLNRPEVQQFLAYYLRAAEDIANNNELIPISDAVRKQQIRRLTDPTAYQQVAEGAVSEPSPDGTTTTATTTSTTTTTTSTDATTPPSTTTGSTSSSTTTTTEATP